MKKSFSKTVIVQLSILFIAIITIFFLIFQFLILITGGGILFLLSEPPPQPEITYGEFPFKLIYKIKGKQITVEDVVICEYDGFSVGSNGKYLNWKKYLYNGAEERIFIFTDGTRNVYCYVGDAEYYMGDKKNPDERVLTPHIYDVKLDHTNRVILSPEKLLGLYNIEIISWAFSDPITNSFK